MPVSAAASARGASPSAVSGPAHASSGPDASDKPGIMIVEDDFFIATDLEHQLLQAGYHVVGVAASAAEAIELARRTHPAVAIVDVRLADGSDGVDAALKLYGEFKIRSLFATAHSDPTTRARAEAAVPLGWIAKPYSSQSLVDALKRALAR